jgi:ribonuclease HII
MMPLEARIMMADGRDALANIVGEIPPGDGAGTATIRVGSSDFVLPRNRLILGFSASDEQLRRALGHVQTLAAKGVRVLEVRSSVVCTQQLNDNRRRGINRFVSDLHAMERLVLKLRDSAGEPVHAVCGKVGGIGEYAKFFGPLAGWLHATIVEGQAESAYQFPKLGRLRFLRDADASAPLVMLASLVGKYVRELFMSRIASHYPAAEEHARPSGYHDPVTAAFVERTALTRKKQKLPDRCFERERDPVAKAGATAT